MSIPMDSMCLECQLRRNAELARSLGDEATATALSTFDVSVFATGRESFTSSFATGASAGPFPYILTHLN